MAFIQVKKCLSEPKQLIKLIILVIIGCISTYQLTGCVEKLITPPVSTYYKFLLNESINYPAVTTCRRPSYKNKMFPNFGIKENAIINYDQTFANFPFDKLSIKDFLQNTTYTRAEVIPIYGYGGSGLSSDIAISSSFMLNQGRCFTFTPKVPSGVFSAAGGYFLYFRHDVKIKTKDDYGMSTSGFDIYIHDENEVLTGEEEQENSLMEYIYLESSEDMNVHLELQIFNKITSKGDPCDSTPGYSKSMCEEHCIHKQISRQIGCTLPWLRVDEEAYPQCSDYQSVKELVSFLNTLNRRNYLQHCNCLMPCLINVYKSHIRSRKEADAIVQPGSTINIYFPTNLITQTKEVIGYDWNVFLADIGGSIGFLLGLSVIGMVTLLEKILDILFGLVRRNKVEGSVGSESTKSIEHGRLEDSERIFDDGDLEYLAGFVREQKKSNCSQSTLAI